MQTNTNEKILSYITVKGQASINDLSNHLGITRQAIHKQVNRLLDIGKIQKIGRPPKVFYLINKTGTIDVAITPNTLEVDLGLKKAINENFMFITPLGQKKLGWEGFAEWCKKRNLPIFKTAINYVSTLQKYDKFRVNGLIDGMNKLKNTFDQIYVDKIFYLDFYSIDRFGKTKLGQELLYAKQSQDKKLIKDLIEVVRPRINELIRDYKIDGVGFIPPTVKREIQFMKELEKNLHLKTRIIKISKAKTEIAIPQKTLSKLPDRIENAKNTIFVEENSTYNNILLIDDAVGSGATINETAAQIKRKGICKNKIIGLSITGSFKGFDIISEV